MRYYIDSNIVIWHLRGDARATKFLAALDREDDREFWMGALQRSEMIFYLRNHEINSSHAVMSRFRTQAVTEEIIDKAARIFREWHPSHGLDEHDAIQAATVITTGGVLYTLNTKHFPMPGLVVKKPW